ncbi:MAG: hypothetical protein AAB416_02570 [Patescibacteria group bacterium]
MSASAQMSFRVAQVGQGKFIVVLESEEIVLYAGKAYSHRDLADEVSAKKVLGGGDVTVRENEVMFYDYSGAFKGIPSEIVEGWSQELLVAFKAVYPELAIVRVGTACWQKDRVEFWKKGEYEKLVTVE